MATPKGTHFVISGGFVGTGAPSYLRADGSWAADLQQAHPAASEQERDALLTLAQRDESVACDAYFFPVRLEDGAIDPLTAREEIRAKGPTIPMRRPDRAA